MPPAWVAHCLLVETGDRLVLVDTGFGRDDVAQGRARLGHVAPLVMGFDLLADDPAAVQLPGLGHRPEEVTDVVVTHLDLDHAGGLPDFPGARVHVHRAELAAAREPSWRDRSRYVAAQWAHGPQWVEHDEAGESWFGFEGVTPVTDDVLLVPLPGHTLGHSAVAVRRPAEPGSAASTADRWLLHAGDAYFFHGDKETPRTCPPVVRGLQRLLAADDARRVDNLARLAEVHAHHRDRVTVFCAHDKAEYDALRTPAGRR